MPFRTIVVPIDGSALSEHALPTAAALARASGARLRIVSVLPQAAYLLPLGVTPVESPAGGVYQRSHARIQRYVSDVVQRLRDTGTPDVSGVVRTDEVVDGLLEEIDEAHADLVVMTSHGSGGLRRAWLGSVADALVRQARVPVLVLRGDETGPADVASDEGFDSVLVPLDGSAAAEAALAPALDLARLRHAPITLLRVIDTPYEALPPAAPYGMIVDHVELVRRRREGERYLERVAGRVRDAGVDASTTLLVEPSPVRAILERAAALERPCVVMATHGYGGFKRMLVGSVADKVLRAAEVPVLLFRPDEAVAEESPGHTHEQMVALP